MTIRLVLADDHAIVREGLEALLKTEKDIEVVGQAGDGHQAIEAAIALAPNVMVMDVAMPELNGVEACRRIRQTAPAVQVLVLSMHSDRRFIRQMLQAGARGYLRKGCSFQELVTAIRTVAAGKTYLSPDIAGTVADDYTRRIGPARGASAVTLTPREREVLQLLAEGYTPKQIAARLNITTRTVSTHRRNMMAKVGATTLAELVKFAIREGVTSLED